ncbi:MAG: alpha/beta hydrolase [Saprospiraceae bacterium]
MKWLKYFLLLLLLFLGIIIGFNYHADIPLETLKEKYAYPDSRFVKIEEMEVHYRKTGSGPNLVLLHGTGASLHTWEEWTKELQDSFTIISLDLPAFGLTGPFIKDVDYGIRHYASFLDGFVKAIGVDRFFLAGNSLGGLIAWKYTLDYPAKVKKLILLDAGGFPRDTTGKTPLAFSLAQNKITAAILKKVTPTALFKKSLSEVYGDPAKVNDELLQRYFELFLRPGNRQAYVDRINQKETVIDPQNLTQITQPCLILWGDMDRWIAVQNAHKFAALLPNDTLIIYPGVGHVPMEEIPQQTVADVRFFLQE